MSLTEMSVTVFMVLLMMLTAALFRFLKRFWWFDYVDPSIANSAFRPMFVLCVLVQGSRYAPLRAIRRPAPWADRRVTWNIFEGRWHVAESFVYVSVGPGLVLRSPSVS